MRGHKPERDLGPGVTSARHGVRAVLREGLHAGWVQAAKDGLLGLGEGASKRAPELLHRR